MPKQHEIDEARVQDALRELELHPDIPVRTAANKHGAKYKRVLARRKGVQSKAVRPGSNRKLNDFEEQLLLQYIDRMERIGTATLLSQVHDAAMRIIALHTPPGQIPLTIRRDWTKRFVKRNPSCKKVK
jgi:hypothetical protein